MTMYEGFVRKAARVRVPASSSNLGPAFDAVGAAVKLYLTVEIERLEAGPSRIELHGRDVDLLPADRTNLIWRTVIETAARKGVEPPPFSMRVDNRIPITRGLGSSAAAALAGAAAADFLCGLSLGREGWLEVAAAADGHPDNAAAALYGGVVASMTSGRILCARAPLPGGWTFVAVTPDSQLETKVARAALPSRVPYRDAVFNVQRTAFLMMQIACGRREGLREAMKDVLHQTYRSRLIPGLEEILEMEDRPGLLGVALSGAGPTVVALADSHQCEIGDAVAEIFARHGLRSEVQLLEADNEGLTMEETTAAGPAAEAKALPLSC